MSHHHAKSASLIHINWIFTFSPINWPALSCWPASEGYWENWEASPSFFFPLPPPLMATDWRGEAFSFSFPLHCGDQLSHYRLMTFVGANPFVGEKTVCVLLSWSLYSLLTCLRQCPGPWRGGGGGVGAMCSEWLRFPAARGETTGVKENNPTQSCSASTQTRSGGGCGTSRRLVDMLTRPRCFGLCQGGRIALCSPNVMGKVRQEEQLSQLVEFKLKSGGATFG